MAQLRRGIYRSYFSKDLFSCVGVTAATNWSQLSHGITVIWLYGTLAVLIFR